MMTSYAGFSQEDLCSMLEYDEKTGSLFWKQRPPTTPHAKAFNARYPGKKVGRPARNGYLTFSVRLNGELRPLLAHRAIFLMKRGYLPEFIDHINRVKSDNRIENLRESSRQLNEANKKPGKRNSSGYKGVVFDVARQRWAAYIRVDGKSKNLGRFDCVDDAEMAYNAAAAQAFGCHAVLNDIAGLQR